MEYPCEFILEGASAPDRTPPLGCLAHIAEDQWGPVTTRQAEQAIVPWSSLARMVADGRLERVASGVYRLRGARAPDHLELRAAWLQLDPDRPAWQRIDDLRAALVSHTSAALYGVGDLRTDLHEFTVPVRRQTRQPDVRLHRGAIAACDRLILHGLPATRAGRMIGDLLSDHGEPAAIAQITREVLDHAYDLPRVVAAHVAPYAARYGLQPRDGLAMLDYLLRLAGVIDPTEWREPASPDAGLR